MYEIHFPHKTENLIKNVTLQCWFLFYQPTLLQGGNGRKAIIKYFQCNGKGFKSLFA